MSRPAGRSYVKSGLAMGRWCAGITGRSGQAGFASRSVTGGPVTRGKVVKTMSDATAVAMVLAGDLEAFAELVERYDRSIGACLLSIVRNREDTKDLKAQCWEELHAKLGKFDPKRSFRSWALGFARNLGYYYLRSRKRAPKMVSFDAMPEEEQPTMPGP
ncbi:MAG: RNA polymerase sigma factor, partial [candidate division WOR-3 bacterium]|nr:RNA polymerase sigma factor [candidate division WOR-3 bacterium]